MIKTAADGLKEFWFCSNTSSKRGLRYRRTPMPASTSTMSAEGLMLIEKGLLMRKRREFWSDGMERYYPLGCTDPDFALIKFTASKGNYYHELKNTDFDINE